jgi:DAK2 domain fusion protein YloV
VNPLERLRALARAALANLEANRQRIDDLNVYPVPDGDTGTNLVLTLRAVVEALDASRAPDRATAMRELARAALMGARGNSGVIFSQIVRGAADVLAGVEGEVTAADAARALRAASDAAYRAVRRPVEGTMLSVVRELAEEAELPAHAGETLAGLLRHVVRRGEEAVARTPEQLDVLREAGVVDAGGTGLLEIVRGVAAELAGEPLPERAAPAEELGVEAVHQELSRYRYCTVFLVEGEGLDAAALEAELERLGDSLLVVGDERAVKVHVHTDDPGAALSLGVRRGAIAGVEIANMHEQTAERTQRLLEQGADVPTLETGVVAVVPGAGNRRLFESYGATRIVEGGQSMNPSTAELLDAIEATPATEVLVLPNNANVVLTAEQAARLARKPVRVIPSTSVPAGLAALVRYLPTRSGEANERAMREALAQVRTGEVTVASRDADLDGIAVRKGAFLGLAEGRAVASGDSFVDVAAEVVERLLNGGCELLTVLTGAEAPPVEPLLERVQSRHPDVEVDVQEGGQPHYPLLLSAE